MVSPPIKQPRGLLIQGWHYTIFDLGMYSTKTSLLTRPIVLTCFDRMQAKFFNLATADPKPPLSGVAEWCQRFLPINFHRYLYYGRETLQLTISSLILMRIPDSEMGSPSYPCLFAEGYVVPRLNLLYQGKEMQKNPTYTRESHGFQCYKC